MAMIIKNIPPIFIVQIKEVMKTSDLSGFNSIAYMMKTI